MLLILTRSYLVRGLDVWDTENSEIFAIVENPTRLEERLCKYIAENSYFPSWSKDPEGNRLDGKLPISCFAWESTMDVVQCELKEINDFREKYGKYKDKANRLTIHWAGGDIYCPIPKILEPDPEKPKGKTKPHNILEWLFDLAAPGVSGRNTEGDGYRIPRGFGSGNLWL